MTKNIKKATYILIHGSFHGAWCWEKLIPFLEKAAQEVVTPDAHGQGKNHQSYVQIVEKVLANQAFPVILVGHSSGGMVISELAKKCPDKIKALVYLSAFLLPDGIYPPMIIKNDKMSLMPYSIAVDTQANCSYVRKEMAKEVFYADCSEPVAAWAISLLTPEPVIPKVLSNIDEKPTELLKTIQIPRFYIETTNDKALGIDMQRYMCKLLPCEKVYTLQTSHSAFLSAPDKLAEILLDINNQVSI